MIFSCILAAQTKFEDTVQKFKDITGARVSYHRATRTPSFVHWEGSTGLLIPGGGTSQQRSRRFLEQHGAIFGTGDLQSQLLLKNVKTDQHRFEHLTYQQVVDEIPVFGAQLKFHYDPEGQLRCINGLFLPEITVSPHPDISEEEASNLSKQHIHKQFQAVSSDLEMISIRLLFFQKGLLQGFLGDMHLVYEVELAELARGLHEYVYLDAHTGMVVDQMTGSPTLLYRRLYESNTGNEIWTEGDTYPDTLDHWQQTELEAAAHIYFFFFHAFGYESFDGAGAEMHTVNNSAFINCPNASWNGYQTSFCDGTAADDIVGHEWAHAYTEYTNDLIYQWQAGALNESYSDIWGETIDLINGYEDTLEDLSLRSGCGSSDRWILGEDAVAFGGALRDMWDPRCAGDPGKVSDPEYWCSSSDQGGVHTNSGVHNHAYALLVDGGSYNGYSIDGLGITKSAHIFWRAQSLYLTPTSDFAVQADALEAACYDLIGIDLQGLSTTPVPAGPSGEVITTADLTQLQKVLLAVEMRLDPGCGYNPILDPELLVLCNQALPENAIFHEDFEGGLNGWTTEEVPINPTSWEAREWEIVSTLPDGREGMAAFGVDPINGDCINDLQNGIIRLQSPVISIPDTIAGDVNLIFDHYVAMENRWDGGNLKVQIEGSSWTTIPRSAFTYNAYNDQLRSAIENDNPLAGQDAFTGTNSGSVSGSWGQSVVNLTSLGIIPGNDLQLRFELGTDGCNGRLGWYLDNLIIYGCGPCKPSLTLDASIESQAILFEAGMEITSEDSISGSSQIIYDAGEEVHLSSGFEISTGSVLEVMTNGCDMLGATHIQPDGAKSSSNRKTPTILPHLKLR